MGVYIHTDQSYYPNVNTVAYYTFDDQDVNQITDFSWSWNTLPYTAWTKISYTQLSWTDYYWNFNKSQYTWSITWISNYTRCMWCKIAATWSQYILQCTWIDLIYWFNSWQIEVYDYYNWHAYRTTLKSSTPLNTWMLIWFTKNWSTVTTYYNWSKVWTATFADYQLTLINLWWTSSQWFNWSLNNIILENRVRTDAEMLDYFNKSKWAYWIS